MDNRQYLIRLKTLHDRIVDQPMYSAIFFALCKQYERHLMNNSTPKYLAKEQLLQVLIDKGILNYSIDKITHEKKLPDDRTLRKAVRTLTRYGYPIISSSKVKGYCIADNSNEVVQPMQENHKRAIMCLAVEKGYGKMQAFINGQLDCLDTVFDTTLDYDF